SYLNRDRNIRYAIYPTRRKCTLIRRFGVVRFYVTAEDEQGCIFRQPDGDFELGGHPTGLVFRLRL
ncbi:hypothetical protein, partial [Leptospira fainei]|uniref:hypothetical protein n=1 Tax=Leptospira fainei TaxID=48782 RepID=UPI001E3BF6BE